MRAASLLLAIASTQVPVPATDCEVAIARGTSTAAAQVCLAEAEFAQARVAQQGSLAWTRFLENAAVLYKRAFGLPADEVIQGTIIERLLIIFDEPMLNNPTEVVAAFGELARLHPTEAEPLLRLAKYQEVQGSLDAAEETLLAARRLRPEEIEPFQMLARFYARRASALHTSVTSQQIREETPPGAPDKNGVYQVGGSVTPPRRFGNPTYPVDAMAAGADGVVTAEITVDESGIVTDVRVLKSNPLLDEAAMKAVKEWRYDPTTVEGKAVPVKMTVTVNFSLRR